MTALRLTAIAGVVCATTGMAYGQSAKTSDKNSGERPATLESSTAQPRTGLKGERALSKSANAGQAVLRAGDRTYVVDGPALNAKQGNFTGNVLRGAPPANDECGASFINIGDGQCVAYDTTTATTSTDADGGAAGPCDFFGEPGFENDVWFEWDWFGAGFQDLDTVTISTNLNGTNDDTKIAVYDACSGNIIACNDDVGGGDLSSSVTFTIDGANVVFYEIRVGSPLGFGATPGTGELCFSAGAPASGNDECVDATAISGNGPFFADTSLATTGGDPGDPLCLDFGQDNLDNDLWFEWDASGLAAGTLVSVSACNSATDSRIAVYTECPSINPASIVACDDDGCGTIAGPSLAEFTHDGVTSAYIIRVGLFPGATTGIVEFNVDTIEAGTVCLVDNAGLGNGQERDLASNTISDLTNFTSADNTKIAAGGDGSITEICWWGFYQLGQTIGDSFQVAYYDDNSAFAPGVALNTFVQGSTLTVSGPVFTGDVQTLGGVDFNVFEYTGTHAGVSVAAGDCIWIEIVNTLEEGWSWCGAGDPTSNPAGNLNGDGLSLTTDLLPYDGACNLFPADMAWRIDEPIAVFDCSVPAVPANDDCGNAEALVVSAGGSDSATGTTCGATTDECAARDCIVGAGILVDTGVWYSVVGNGNTMTATTDNPGTAIDTTLSIYCGTCGDLNCVASNDDATGAATPLTSTVSWCAANGTTYFIFVQGFDDGNFDLTVSDDNTSCGAAASCSACSVSLSGNIDENEPCGTDNNGGCFTDEITPVFGPAIADGDVVNGNFWAQDGLRDTDWYPFTLTETSDVTASVTADRFALFGFVNTATNCNLDQLTFVGGGQLGDDQTCEKSSITRRLAAGSYALVVLPGDFFNVCCENGGADYTAGISVLPVGSCCFEGGVLVGPNGTDDCANAPSVSEGTYRFDNTLATSLGDTAGNTSGQPTTTANGTLFRDVWYLYTASDDGEATATSCDTGLGAASWDTELAVYDALNGCPDGDDDGTNVASNDDFCGLQSSVSWFVTAGSQWLIRAGSFSDTVTGAGFLTISLDAGGMPPVLAGADFCSDALLQTAVGTGSYLVGNGLQTTDGFDELLCTGAGSSQVQNDWWVLYEATSTGTSAASFCVTGNTTDTRIAIYNASCPIGIDEAIACDDDSCLDAGFPQTGPGLGAYVEWATTAGTQYLIRCGTFSAAAFINAEMLEISEVAPGIGAGVAGSNGDDECATATTITLAGPGTVTHMCDNTAATSSIPNFENVTGCTFASGEFLNDLWYTWTAPADGVAVASTRDIDGTFTQDFDTRIAIYATNCPTFDGESIACDDDGAADALLSQVTWNTVNGTTYLIRVGASNFASGGLAGNVFLDLEFIDPGSAGDNGSDLCGDAPAITEGSFVVDNTLASTDGPAEEICLSFGQDQIENDVWYLYTASCDGIATAETTNIGGTLTDTRIAIYGDTCPVATGEAIACDDDGGTGLLSLVSWPVVNGESYLIRVGVFPGAPVSFGTATLDVSIECLAAPTNDTCATAATASDGDNPFDNRLANTDGAAEPGCEFTAGDNQFHADVWYVYTASCTGFTTVETTAFDTGDTRLAVYDACGGNLLACDDDSGTGLLSLVTFVTSAGTDYYIRVGGFSAADLGVGSFNISCVEPAGCFELSSTDCATLGGSFVSGSTCFEDPNPCLTPADGACELCVAGLAPDCFIASEADCTTAGGSYSGDGTDCSSVAGFCPCDWNCDGFLNDQDFFDWTNDFFSGAGPVGGSDYNNDGFENDQDWFDFTNCFFAPGGFPACSS